MDELLTMSKTELTRLEIMKRLEEKRHKQKEAAEMLRQIEGSPHAGRETTEMACFKRV